MLLGCPSFNLLNIYMFMLISSTRKNHNTLAYVCTVNLIYILNLFMSQCVLFAARDY